MGLFPLLLLLAADDAGEPLAKKMLPIYVAEAKEYTISVESAPEKRLDLKQEPVFEWSNPTRAGGQQGVVFVWLRDSRPAALGCIFSASEGPGARRIVHELHALDSEKLLIKRDGFNQWKPQAGLKRAEVPGAGVPADAPGSRGLQLRQIAREFSGHTVGAGEKKWDLRTLPTPLYRYPLAKTGVVDGALFGMVTEAGTDPEALLIIEARIVDGKARWEFACGRFTDWELHVHHKEKDVFTSNPQQSHLFRNDKEHLYRIYPDKIVTLEGKTIARIRESDTKPYGEVVPVSDK